MAVVTLELPWEDHPPPYTPLDLRNPLNRELGLLVYGGVCARAQGPAISGIDVQHAHQAPLTLYSGSPTIKPHRDGIGPMFSGGAQTYVAGATGNAIGTGAFTLEVVVRATSIPSLCGFLANGYVANGDRRGLIAYGGGSNKNIYFWGAGADLASGTDWLEDGSLQHVFCVSEGSGLPMRFYRGAREIYTGTTPTLTASSNRDWYVGDAGNGWAQSPTGAIIKAAFYRRALTYGEIRLLTERKWANFEPMRFDIPFTPAAGTVPNITFVGAENITATSADYRVTLDFA